LSVNTGPQAANFEQLQKRKPVKQEPKSQTDQFKVSERMLQLMNNDTCKDTCSDKLAFAFVITVTGTITLTSKRFLFWPISTHLNLLHHSLIQ